MYKSRSVTVILAAGGAGTRFGAKEPKQFLDIGGRSMLAAAASAFVRSDFTDEIIFVVPDGFEEYVTALLARELNENIRAIPLRVVSGGADRAASVRAGLCAAEFSDGLVLIHDAARPFVSEALIERVLEAAEQMGAAVPVVMPPVRDTLYIADENGMAAACPDRAALRMAQTPQGFDGILIRDAHFFSDGLSITDDGGAVLATGQAVALVEGDPANIKITLPGDLAAVSAQGLSARNGEGMRVGIGFDAHSFVENRPLVLGGVEIPFEKGLLGHSDADVLTHALMDAILGALCEGDIGRRFPDTDPAYAGISSMILLERVTKLMRVRGFEIGNVDLTLVAEKPRMAPYREQVEKTLADVLGTVPENISLKATTTEKLGFTGREEGIAAEAAVLLRKTDRRSK